MINYKEKYLKYKKKYLKIRKMFGGSRTGVANEEPPDEEPPDDWRYDEALLRLDKQLAKLEGNPEILKIDGETPKGETYVNCFGKERPTDVNRFGRKCNKNNKNNKNTLLFGGGILIAAITSVVLLLK